MGNKLTLNPLSPELRLIQLTVYPAQCEQLRAAGYPIVLEQFYLGYPSRFQFAQPDR